MIGNEGGRFRFFCGRTHRGPFLPRYSRTNGDGLRKDPWGKGVPDYQWHPGRLLRPFLGLPREVWTCRRSKEHWRLTLIPSREVLKLTNVVDFSKVDESTIPRSKREWLLLKVGVLPKRGIPRPVITQEMRPHKTNSWELGHRYYFNRREL